jgi:hypothetical protein
MRIDRVTATVRYSQDSGKGAWKSVELGAEATVDDRENWREAQANLYQQLGQQIKTLWANGSAAPVVAAQPRDGAEPLRTPAPSGNGAGSHWCKEHQTEFRQFQKGDQIWYSHRNKDGMWCKQK